MILFIGIDGIVSISLYWSTLGEHFQFQLTTYFFYHFQCLNFYHK